MFDGVWAVARRELMVASRQPKTYQGRVAIVLGGLLGIGAGFVGAVPQVWPTRGELPAATLRQAARHGALGIVVVCGTMLVMLSAQLAGGLVAGERERKALDSLLATSLSAAEIVLGKFVAGLLRCGMTLGAVLPVFLLLLGLGGVSWAELGLACAGQIGMAASLVAFGLAVSARMRTPRAAVAWTVVLIVAWLEVPFLLGIIGPRYIPSLYAWLRPVNLAIMDSSPIRLLAGAAKVAPAGGSLAEMLARMVAWQLLGVVGLMIWTIARLRPVSRRIGGGERRLSPRWAYLGRRPPCGDDPMGWKERHVTYSRLTTRAGVALAFGSGFLILALITGIIARPALREWAEAGYAWSAPMYARWEFNQAFVRPISAVLGFMLLMVMAGMTSEAIDLERKNDTWTVLLSTPLDGRAIVGAKRAAAFRRCRPLLVMVGLLWGFAMLVGAVHPVGVLLGAWSLYALVQLALAQGVHASTGGKGKEGDSSTDRTIAWLMALMLAAPAPCLLTGQPAFAPLAALAPPVGIILSLWSHNEVRAATGSEAFVGLRLLNLDAGYGTAAWTTAAALLMPLVVLLVARLLERHAYARFDRAMGRPYRLD